jgi:D-alanyl-D-alanine carboxypeptidase (penicillin-binding protein 5/6)
MKKLFAAFAASLLAMSAAVAQTLPPPTIAAKSWLLLDATRKPTPGSSRPR